MTILFIILYFLIGTAVGGFTNGANDNDINAGGIIAIIFLWPLFVLFCLFVVVYKICMDLADSMKN